MKKVVWSLTEFTICFIIFMIFEPAIHEFCHLVTAIAFGGYGYITWKPYPLPHWECILTEPVTGIGYELFLLMGGLGTAILFTLLFLTDYLFMDDIEEACATLPIIFKNLIYGVTEWLVTRGAPVQIGNLMANIGFVIGVLLAVYILVWKYRVI